LANMTPWEAKFETRVANATPLKRQI
jgi:hypothetical protein